MTGMYPFTHDKDWILGIGCGMVLAGLSLNYMGFHQLKGEIESLREDLEKKTRK